MTLCVGCHSQIDPAYAFCPGCGIDNRDPVSRPAIPAHVHDYRGDGYCIACGQARNFDPATKPKNGYSFDTDYFDLWHRVLGVAVTIGLALLWIWLRRSYDDSDWFETALATPYPTIAAALITLSLFLGRARTNVDCASQTVYRSIGLWPVFSTRMYRFEHFSRIAVPSRYMQNRNGPGHYVYNPSLVRADGNGSVPIGTNLREGSLDKVSEVAHAMNLPVDSLFDPGLL